MRLEGVALILAFLLMIGYGLIVDVGVIARLFRHRAAVLTLVEARAFQAEGTALDLGDRRPAEFATQRGGRLADGWRSIGPSPGGGTRRPSVKATELAAAEAHDETHRRRDV